MNRRNRLLRSLSSTSAGIINRNYSKSCVSIQQQKSAEHFIRLFLKTGLKNKPPNFFNFETRREKRQISQQQSVVIAATASYGLF